MTHNGKGRRVATGPNTGDDSPPPPDTAALVAALGVVFGDIGTSPLYALRESFGGVNAPILDPSDLLGVLSLILWALVLVISIKYLLFVLRANNQGEGGIIALVALLNPWRSQPGEMRYALMLMGLFGACLLYGDGTITPAISVLSAVEGLHLVAPGLDAYIVPITIAILIGLFAMQRRGSGHIGRLFGPIMLVWFLVLAVLGIRGILLEPAVLWAFYPGYALAFLGNNGLVGFLTLGAVFLVVTGGEALYADLGHFGPSPIRRAWFLVVFPALALNYLGQAALLIHQPTAIRAPFFHLAPDAMLIPLVLLATVATVIASQAVISGTFSLTRQAISLDQLPRMKVIHTLVGESGQIYLPLVNWLLLLACVGLVLGFRSSAGLASAYGVAVSMDMAVTTLLAVAVARRFGWNPWLAVTAGAVFLVIDGTFLGTNLAKIPDGGWYALLIAGSIFILIWSWRRGRALLTQRLSQYYAIRMDEFMQQIERDPPHRAPGTAIVLTPGNQYVPAALIHHMNCTHVLHKRVIFLTVVTADQPRVPASERLEFEQMEHGVVQMRVIYGFSQAPNIPIALGLGEHIGIPIDTGTAIYIVGRQTLLVHRDSPGMPYWQELIFAWLARNATRLTAYYNLPEEQVLELGLQVRL